MNWFFYFFLSQFLGMFVFLNNSQAQTDDAHHHNPSKKALIFGVSGQDGIYLTDFLLKKNYEVHGVMRTTSLPNTTLIGKFYQKEHLLNERFILHRGDLLDSAKIKELIFTIEPDEIYNLGAQSQVKFSFEFPEYTAEINALGTLRILESIKSLGFEKKIKFYQASTSELFGNACETPRKETSPFHPRSPYGVAKLFAFWAAINYRESYNMFACNGILFNHESPIRGESYVTRKITLGACRYKLGMQDILYLGNLDAKRDWGYAKEYVESMWLMLQQEEPDDYVIASGATHSVREFVELAFNELGIEIEWHQHDVEEYGTNKETGEIIIKVNPDFYRPAEIDFIYGDPGKAEKILKWKSTTTLQELVKIMIEADYQQVLLELQQ